MAVPGEGDLVHIFRVAFEYAQKLAGGYPPYPYSVIIPPTCQRLARRVKGQAMDIISVPFERAQQLSTRSIPQSDSTPITPGGKYMTHWADGDAPDIICRERVLNFPKHCVPQHQRAIITPARERPTREVKGDATYVALMAFQDAAKRSARSVP